MQGDIIWTNGIYICVCVLLYKPINLDLFGINGNQLGTYIHFLTICHLGLSRKGSNPLCENQLVEKNTSSCDFFGFHLFKSFVANLLDLLYYILIRVVPVLMA